MLFEKNNLKSICDKYATNMGIIKSSFLQGILQGTFISKSFAALKS